MSCESCSMGTLPVSTTSTDTPVGWQSGGPTLPLRTEPTELLGIEHPIVRDGLIHDVPTVNEIIDRMIGGAVDIISHDMLRRIVRPADSITERRRQG
jgi:hypothetical protein